MTWFLTFDLRDLDSDSESEILDGKYGKYGLTADRHRAQKPWIVSCGVSASSQSSLRLLVKAAITVLLTIIRDTR